jgi:hypothetical protein
VFPECHLGSLIDGNLFGCDIVIGVVLCCACCAQY